MNRDLEEDFLNAARDAPEYQPPGTQALAGEKAVEAQTYRDALNVEADTAWRDTGLDIPYEYQEAYASGATDFKDKPLPNRYASPDTVPVAGYDLATGERKRTTIADRKGTAKWGMAELQGSNLKVEKGKPPESPPLDAGALGQIATAYYREGKTLAEFEKDLPAKWWEPHRKVAWDAAKNAENTRILAHGLKGADQRMFAEPADMEFEQTMADPGFAKSAKTIYRSFHGEPFRGTEMEASRWLGEHLRNFDLNTFMQASIVGHVLRSPVDTSAAYGYALEMWNRTNMQMDLQAQLKNTGRLLFDPTNLLGFGIGKATIVTAGRKAFGDVLKRLGAGAAAGGVSGAQQAIGSAAVSGKDPTQHDIAGGIVLGAAAGAAFNAGLPELLSAGGVLVKRGMTNLGNSTYVAPGSPTAQVGAVGPDLRRPAIPPGYAAARNEETGFYSPVALAISKIKEPEIAVPKLMNVIRSQADVRQEELDWLDLDSFIGDRTVVSTAEVLEYANANRLPVSEKWMKNLSQAVSSREDMIADFSDRSPGFAEIVDNLADKRHDLEIMQNALANRNVEIGAGVRLADDPVYRELSVERTSLADAVGKIERDIDRILADVFGDPTPKPLMYPDMTVGGFGERREANYRILTVHNPLEETRFGNSAHPGGDEFGTIGWARLTDRAVVDADGNAKGTSPPTALFAEEIQSDIHSDKRKAVKAWDKVAQANVDPRTYEQMRWDEYLKFLSGEDKAGTMMPGSIEIVRSVDGYLVMNDAGQLGEFPSRSKALEFVNKLNRGQTSRGLPKHWDDATKAQKLEMNESTFFAQTPTVWPNPADKKSGIALVPDEVLSDNFLPAMLKRLLFQASKEGKDYLAWTSGEKQAEYYGKQKLDITQVTVVGGKYGDNLSMIEIGGKTYSPRHLEKIGLTLEDVAAKLRASGQSEAAEALLSPPRYQSKVYDLKDKPVEARPQGYKFYDAPAVDAINKFLKRYGAKVEKLDLEGGADGMWSIKITPELREKILKGGVPLAKLEQANAVA